MSETIRQINGVVCNFHDWYRTRHGKSKWNYEVVRRKIRNVKLVMEYESCTRMTPKELTNGSGNSAFWVRHGFIRAYKGEIKIRGQNTEAYGIATTAYPNPQYFVSRSYTAMGMDLLKTSILHWFNEPDMVYEDEGEPKLRLAFPERSYAFDALRSKKVTNYFDDKQPLPAWTSIPTGVQVVASVWLNTPALRQYGFHGTLVQHDHEGHSAIVRHNETKETYVVPNTNWLPMETYYAILKETEEADKG